MITAINRFLAESKELSDKTAPARNTDETKDAIINVAVKALQTIKKCAAHNDPLGIGAVSLETMFAHEALMTIDAIAYSALCK